MIMLQKRIRAMCDLLIVAKEIMNPRFNSEKPFMVGQMEFSSIQEAVCAAAAASKSQENNFSAQICQPFQSGANGYPGSSVVVAHFRDGVDIDALAADEDGVPDMERRSQAFRV